MGNILGIDIGGTSIKVGLFADDGALQSISIVPTQTLAGKTTSDAFLDALESFLDAQDTLADCITAIGLDVPGPVDETGNVGHMPNIQLDVESLKAGLSSAFPHAHVVLANDANAAALGEFWQGSGKGEQSFVLVALGTGVGAGIVSCGKTVSGAFGYGGELGHLTVNHSEQDTCGCGRCGCLEQYASASGVVRTYRKECATRDIEPVHLDGAADSLAVFKASQADDEAAHAALSLMCETLGFALAQVATVIDPGLFLIGGGMGEGFDVFADELRAAFQKQCPPPCLDTRILPATLGNKAAMYGSAYLALQALGM